MGEGDKDFLSTTVARKRLLASASSLMLRKTFEELSQVPLLFRWKLLCAALSMFMLIFRLFVSLLFFNSSSNRLPVQFQVGLFTDKTCSAHVWLGSCFPILDCLWRIARSQQKALCYCRLWARSCFAPRNLYSLFHIADNHIILPFFLSFLPILLTLFLLHWIEPHFRASLNRLYSCDSL